MNRRIWENLGSLYSVHVFNYVVPLFTLPYLARVLGPSHWGAVALADAYGNYVNLIVEFGFSLSATRAVARSQNDLAKRSEQLASVIGAQGLLTVAVVALVLCISFCAKSLAPYRTLVLLACLVAVFRAFMPIWYFQGLERMRLVSIINIGCSLGAAALIFVFVHKPSDNWVPLALRAIAAGIATCVAFGLAYREIPLALPRWSLIRSALRDGGSIFIFKGAVSLYTTANVVILGFLAPATAVAWYAGAEKIMKASLGGIQPLTDSFYPRINSLLETDKRSALRTVRIAAFLTIGLALLGSLGLLFFTPLIVRLCLGRGFENSVPVLRVLALLLPIVACNVVLSTHWMLPLHLEGLCNRLVATAGCLNIALALWLAPRYASLGMAWSVLAAELFILTAMVIVLQKRSLAPWLQTAPSNGIGV